MITKDPLGPPTKPNLNIVRVNFDGTFYTWKLAVHYFRKQPDSEERDRCFIITGSMVAYIDSPVSSDYFGIFRIIPAKRKRTRGTGNTQRQSMACEDS